MRAALARRGADAPLDRVLELDERRRAVLTELEPLRERQNAASKAIGEAKRRGEDAAAEIAAMEEVAARGRELSDELNRVEAELQAAMVELPNLPAPDVPSEDTVLREVGEAGRTGRDHLELAGSMIDMQAAARVSGARFAYLRGDLVMLELALVRWAMEKVRGHGFEPVVPPVLVREAAMYGTGFLPDTEQQIYRLPDDDLYLVGTSEVPLASLHAGEVLDEAALPRRYAGFSTCFRREAGAAGKDTRGIFRVHQFDKVEMFSFVEPDTSLGEHERILAVEEELVGGLGLPYRVVNIAAGDLGPAAAKKYDIEAWLPSEGRYRELTSCSNYTDYSARRLGTRVKSVDGAQFVHTLNGTGCAVSRTLAFLFEHYQDADGGFVVPEVLRPYTGFDRVAPRK